ncbi:hypothetical protein F3Y22_tig00113721pilonHSYRG00041 [Hibiscus syriacus]|uniref:Uncharacterized protein n=1 Tax=Hibiscus syriacus TaxID=106335 RepID=A0A6A2Y243_HIBSY|nr:hypothetical protein F3Y22_tig00113721pilonHSYRG00041 [Hibiscus syriacus]
MPPPLFAAAGAIFGFPISIIPRRNVYFKVSCSMEHHNNQSGVRPSFWSLNQTFQDSLRLLQETDAAIQMHNHDSFNLDLTSVDLALVEAAIKHARRLLPLDANKAMALLSLLQFFEALQLSLKAAIKQDSDWYKQFMPLSEMITQLIVNRSIIKLIQQVIDEDGSVKDSASPALIKARYQVRTLERKLHQLMDNLIRNETKESTFMPTRSVDGRWCIRSGTDQPTSLKGLLLSRGYRLAGPCNYKISIMEAHENIGKPHSDESRFQDSSSGLADGSGSIIEPFAAVPLNDELQQARALVAKAETDVLLMVTEKIQMDLDDMEKSLRTAIQLDMIYARATYSLSYGRTYPNIFLPEDINGPLTAESYRSKDKTSQAPNPKKEWIFYLPRAYHPLLLQQHRQKLSTARKNVRNAASEIRRRKLQAENMTVKGEAELDFSSLQKQVRALEEAPPVPVDFLISQKTRVLVITGPNTGGLHVLSSESAKVPWFDSVFADIGDEQSIAS